MVADLDVDALTDGELDELVIGLQRAKHRLAGADAGPLVRWDTVGTWRTDGSRSPAAMPATAVAVTAGRVSMDHVDLLGRADQPHRHDLFQRDEEMLVEQCATLRYTQAVRAVALVEMATRSSFTPATARRPKPLFTVLLGDDSVGRLCELATGTVITPGQLVPYLGVAEMETILFDGPFTVIAASTARTFTGRLRRAIEVRDRHCQHPSGCDVPAPQCDVDHTVPVTEGGVTNQFGGRIECRPTTVTPPSTTTAPPPCRNDPSPSSTPSAP